MNYGSFEITASKWEKTIEVKNKLVKEVFRSGQVLRDKNFVNR